MKRYAVAVWVMVDAPNESEAMGMAQHVWTVYDATDKRPGVELDNVEVVGWEPADNPERGQS